MLLDHSKILTRGRAKRSTNLVKLDSAKAGAGRTSKQEQEKTKQTLFLPFSQYIALRSCLKIGLRAAKCGEDGEQGEKCISIVSAYLTQ